MISTSVVEAPAPVTVFAGNARELHETGDDAGGLGEVGSLTCVECGYALSLGAIEDVPRCPACGGARFRRASLFEQPTVDAVAVEPGEEEDWLDSVREAVASPGRYLAFEDRGRRVVFELEEGWTRIGRSGSADLRLDDPTVSRRHALVVLTPEDELRALDDRSLNGLFVNGVRVEWASLGDGDELEVGRYRLHVVEA
jgi:predicted  nucleic acid-binding Zn-ribbon protein